MRLIPAVSAVRIRPPPGYKDKLLEKFKNTVIKHHLINRGDRILCAVSGGPDSLTLLSLLEELRKEMDFTLGIAHFHHGIRKEADEDLKFVHKLAKKKNISFYWAKRDVPEIARQKKKSLEEAAREERYNFLLSIAKKYSFSKIAVAHNRDDQVETFLHRLIRGAGLKGLCAIPVKVEIQDVTVIRPLIEISRREIEEYLERCNITPRLDLSNYDTRFTRNKIRQKLIPYLMREFNPNIQEVLYTTVENIQLAYQFISQEVEKAFKRYVKFEPGCVKIKEEKLKKLHPYLKTELVRRAIREVKMDLKRIEYDHWLEIESLVAFRPYGSIVDLPHNIWVKKEKGWLVIGRKKNG
ncbi:MAG: tRNA lysidine(34) synthetase TilS [Candidatus Omnitrophota bacterium]|nr:MAG: tRNA lysidine(34) synthetase TilS [Candidatus Omnitrophota bacterium]